MAAIDGYLAHRRIDSNRSGRPWQTWRKQVTFLQPRNCPMALVRVVYADVPQQVWPAAELSVRAQLEYLAENG